MLPDYTPLTALLMDKDRADSALASPRKSARGSVNQEPREQAMGTIGFSNWRQETQLLRRRL